MEEELNKIYQLIEQQNLQIKLLTDLYRALEDRISCVEPINILGNAVDIILPRSESGC